MTWFHTFILVATVIELIYIFVFYPKQERDKNNNFIGLIISSSVLEYLVNKKGTNLINKDTTLEEMRTIFSVHFPITASYAYRDNIIVSNLNTVLSLIKAGIVFIEQEETTND